MLRATANSVAGDDGRQIDIPQTKIGKLRTVLLDLLREHETDGALPTSARFLYYELVQRSQLSKEKTGARRPDQDLHDALTDLRKTRQVPWHWIEDETRSFDDYTGYAGVRDGVLAKLPFIRLDPWQPSRAPLILTESRSVAGVLRDAVIENAVRIAATNGQVGGFLHTEVAPRLHVGDRVLYIGDHDLAGNQIEENTRRVLEHAVGRLHWERLALTAQQVEHYDLPVIIKGDRRYNDGRPHEAVETEALRQTVLIEILRERLDELLPEPLERVLEREARQRRQMAALLRRRAR
jgi:hypothetical protein